MVYLLVSNILLAVCLCVNTIISHIERTKLTEMLASKDYAQYKNFDAPQTEKEHTNMYKKREEKQNVYIVEGE